MQANTHTQTKKKINFRMFSVKFIKLKVKNFHPNLIYTNYFMINIYSQE